MFDALKGFVADFLGGQGHSRDFVFDDVPLAVAALLVHVGDSDGKFSDLERKRAQELVAERFGLEQAAAVGLMREALRSDHEEVGVDLFVSVLNRALDDDARLKIVSMMWEVVFADGEFNEMEDSMIWRIAGMLGVPAEQREILRRSLKPDDPHPEHGPGHA